MKSALVLLPLAASLVATSAIVRSPLTGNHQIMLHEPGGSNPDSNPRKDVMWNSHPSRSGVRNAVESMVESIGQTLDQAVESVARTGHRTLGQLVGGGGGRHRGDDNRTKRNAWDVIRECRSAKRFAQMIEKHDRIRKRLEDGNEELTVFVPTDEAFRQIESEMNKYSSEYMEKILEYHIVEDEYTAARILGVHTMPTMLYDRELGRERPQRLRVSVGLTGMHLNFYSQVIATNVESSNAMIHAIDQVLLPPPRQGNIVEAIPGKFSTFTLAMETTGLAEELENEKQRGGTVFVPTNTAWAKLGQAANSFLFSDKGKPYLRALLEYHIAANETLYSDAFYQSEEGRRHRGGQKDVEDEYNRHRHHHGRYSVDSEEDVDAAYRHHHNSYVDWDEEGVDEMSRNRRPHRRPHHRRPHHMAELYDDEELEDVDEMSRNHRHPHHMFDDDESDEDVDTDRHNRHGRHGHDHRRRPHHMFDEEDVDADRHSRHGRHGHDHHRGGHSRRPGHSTGNDNDNKRHHHRQDDLDSVLKTSFPKSHRRIELPTLAEERTLHVDVSRWMGLVGMIVNGRYRVTVQDGIARDGVVHVVESVIMPPRHGGRKGHEEDEEENRDLENVSISVEELMERLKPLVEKHGRHHGFFQIDL